MINFKVDCLFQDSWRKELASIFTVLTMINRIPRDEI